MRQTLAWHDVGDACHTPKLPVMRRGVNVVFDDPSVQLGELP